MMKIQITLAAIAALSGAAAAQSVELSLLAVGSDLTDPPASLVQINGGRAVTWTLAARVVGAQNNLGIAFLAADLAAGASNPGPLSFRQGQAGPAFAAFEPPLGFARLNDDDSSAFGGDVVACGLRDIGGGLNTAAVAPGDTRFGLAYDLEGSGPTNTGVAGWETFAIGRFSVPDLKGTYAVTIGRAGATVLGSTPIADFATPVRKVGVEWPDGTVTVEVLYCLADLTRDDLLDLADITAFVNGFMALDPIDADVNDDGLFDLTDITVYITAFVAGCSEIEGHTLTAEEQAVLQQLAQQMAQAGSGGILSSALPGVDVGLVDTVAPLGVVTAADIADYIERFSARTSTADLTGDAAVDIEDAAQLLNAVESAGSSGQ